MRDLAIELVFDELVEIKQREETRRVRDEEAGEQVIARQFSAEPNQQRVERKERRLGSRVAGGRDADVVFGIPASPDGKQRVLRGRVVDARALPDDDRCKFGDDDDRHARYDERHEHIAHGRVEACGDEQLRHTEERESERDRAPLRAQTGRGYDDQPQQDQRRPRGHIPVQRGGVRNVGPMGEVARVGIPQHDCQHGPEDQGEQ